MPEVHIGHSPVCFPAPERLPAVKIKPCLR